MNGANRKVLIISSEVGEGAWFHQAEMLRAAIPAGDAAITLVDEPAEADFIFITDMRDRNDHYRNLREHPLVRRYPERCFVVGERDQPPRWIRGIQTSITKTPFNFRRFHSGSYSLFHPDFLNRYIIEAARAPQLDRRRQYLATFTGRGCIPLRKRLFAVPFNRPDIFVKDTSAFNAFTHDQTGKDEAARRYCEVMLESKFALCPRGLGAASIRLFEAMSLGVAPIIISNDWLLPLGPRWHEFALFVREDGLDRIEDLVTAHESEWQERGRRARETFERFFTTEGYVRYLVRAAQDISSKQIVPEKWIHRLWPLAINVGRVQRRLGRARERWSERIHRRERKGRQFA